MSIKNCICLFIIFSVLCSCKNKAVNFNNSLVGIQKSVLTQVHDFGEKVQQVNVDSLQESGIRSEAEKIASYIDNKIAEAQNLTTPKEGENLRMAFLKQLEFEKDMVTKIGRLAQKDISKEEKAQIEIEFLNSKGKANELESNVHIAQEIFAHHHNFKLQKK
jgi:hypothetical protein